MRRITPSHNNNRTESLQMRNLAIPEIRLTLLDEITRVRIQHVIDKADKYEFPDFLRALRGSIRFTQADIARLMGCSLTRIVTLERGKYGKTGPRPEFVGELANLYGLDYYFLYEKWRKYQRKYAGVRTHENKAL